MWKKHFSSFLNTSSFSDATKFVDFKLQSFESYHNLFLAECTIDTISPLIHKLKLNCAPGVDGISAKHFIAIVILVLKNIYVIFFYVFISWCYPKILY